MIAELQGPYRPTQHIAPVIGTPTLFANVEFRIEKPPKEISLGGFLFRRVDEEAK